MNAGIVNRTIGAVVRPILKDRGFDTFTARSAWRFHERVVDVINFQSFNRYNADVLGCTTFSFALNLGIYLTDVPADHRIPVRKGRITPEEYHCHIRRRLKPTQPRLQRAPDVWVINATGDNVEEAVQAAALELLDVAMPWFDEFHDLSLLLAMLREEFPPPDADTWLPGSPGSPHRNIVTGYLARSLGDRQLGAQYLRKALSQLQAIDAAREQIGSPMNRMVPRHLVETVAKLDDPSA